jgi:hypothetical protein
VSGVLVTIKIDSKLLVKGLTMIVFSVGMCFGYISSHPPGCTAGSLIYNYVTIKSTHGIYIFSLTISSMVNRTLLD